MIFFVFEAHRALDLGRGVDELAQWITGQRVIVAAAVYIVEAAGLGEVLLGVDAVEQEAFDLVGGIQGITVCLELLARVLLQDAA